MVVKGDGPPKSKRARLEPDRALCFSDLPDEMVEAILRTVPRKGVLLGVCARWRQIAIPLLSRQVLCDVLNDAIRGGHADRARWAYGLLPEGARGDRCSAHCVVRKASLYEAGRRGHLEVLEWADEHGALASANDIKWVAEGAISRGQAHVVRWALGDIVRDNKTAVSSTISRKSLYGVKWLYGQGHFFDGCKVCKDAADCGELEILAWLVDEARRPWNPSECLESARKSVRPCARTIAWIETRAADYTDVDLARWRALDRPWTDVDGATDEERWHTRCVEAASRGNIGLLTFLDKCTDFERDARACTAASAAGRIDTIGWLRQHGFAWDEGTCAAAAHAGRAQTLARLVLGGCAWNPRECITAALAGGHAHTARRIALCLL